MITVHHTYSRHNRCRQAITMFLRYRTRPESRPKTRYIGIFSHVEIHWRTQRGEVKGVQTPPLNLQKMLYCVFAKYTLQALLLCSLNPKCYTGKRYKLYANFTFLLQLLGHFVLQTPARPPNTWTPSIIKSWVRLCWDCHTVNRKWVAALKTVHKERRIGSCGTN